SLRLTGASDLMTRGDATLLARVFQNLIENGIRYNREGGEVVVNVCAEGEWLVVTVADTGSGIPAEEQSRIFDRFYRVDPSRSRHRGGASAAKWLMRCAEQQPIKTSARMPPFRQPGSNVGN
ncbi:ATP-binding protein, partial [Dehalococcoidia bacterium]|nr:ATP-binding protein [Dehalococcoidia bacterium]